MGYKVFSLLEPNPRRGIIQIERKHPALMRWVEPIGLWIDRFLERDIGLVLDRVETYVHPQEDYLLMSKIYPIFVVADGVTLDVRRGAYPVPSGAGKAAKIFCETIIKEAQARYDTFTEMSLREIFKRANDAVGEYNKSKGRMSGTVNYWDFDFFSATGAFVIVKDGMVYWASICDSSVAHFDRNGKLKFRSPGCWSLMEKRIPKKWKAMDEDTRTKLLRKTYRNNLDEKGEKIGYGVVTGEKEAERYLNTGTFAAKEGDFVALFTDGFEEYMKLPEFVSLFLEWPEDLEERVKSFTKQKSKEEPQKFSHERSLIMVSS